MHDSLLVGRLPLPLPMKMTGFGLLDADYSLAVAWYRFWMRWNGKRAKIKTVRWLRRTVKKKAWVIKKEHQGNKEYMHKWSSGPLAQCTCRYTRRNSFPHTCIWIFRPSQLFLLFLIFCLSLLHDRCAVYICIYMILHEFFLSLSLPNEFSVCLSIMSCELLSISISLIFSFYWSWIVFFGIRDYNQNALIRAHLRGKREISLVPFMKFAYSTNWTAFKNLRIESLSNLNSGRITINTLCYYNSLLFSFMASKITLSTQPTF